VLTATPSAARGAAINFRFQIANFKLKFKSNCVYVRNKSRAHRPTSRLAGLRRTGSARLREPASKGKPAYGKQLGLRRVNIATDLCRKVRSASRQSRKQKSPFPFENRLPFGPTISIPTLPPRLGHYIKKATGWQQMSTSFEARIKYQIMRTEDYANRWYNAQYLVKKAPL